MEKLFNEIKISKKEIGKSKMTSGNAYRITVSRNGKSIWFVYNDNYRNASTNEEFIRCLLLDAYVYDSNPTYERFCYELGYDRDHLKDAKYSYDGCKKQSERLHKLFTEKEIEQLTLELEVF